MLTMQLDTASCCCTTVQQDDGPLLLSGERVEVIQCDVILHCPYYGPVEGILCITNYRIIFRYRDVSQRENKYMSVPLGVVAKVKSTWKKKILVICKDARNMKISIKENIKYRRRLLNILIQLCFPLTYNRPLFAFFHKHASGENGWQIYNPVAELKRMMVVSTISWKITNLNERYDVSRTYPGVWGVPSDATNNMLLCSIGFRLNGRLPILSWLHQRHKAAIIRCSQPAVGFFGKRNLQDERLMELYVERTQTRQLYIVDARLKISADLNKCRGGGYETYETNEERETIFLHIPNIHVVRKSHSRLKKMCYPGLNRERFWLGTLQDTHWLLHIATILTGVVFIIDIVHRHKSSVLVHCSDGWDRTPQLTSLAMLMMDPYYRSIKGFEILIEKEWISFGHKFQQRIGHGVKSKNKQRSPIFVQWLDCVYQIMRQFPEAFQFNERFLLTIVDHLYSCRFGTFLRNCERDRKIAELNKNTASLWSYMNSKIELYINSHWLSTDDKILVPNANIAVLTLWTGLHCRWNLALQDHVAELVSRTNHKTMRKD